MIRLSSAANAAISCKILVKIGAVVSAENIPIDGNCAATRLRQPFSISSHMYGDYKTDKFCGSPRDVAN